MGHLGKFILCSANFLIACILCWVLFEKGYYDAVVIFTLYGVFHLIFAFILFVRYAKFPKGNGFNPFYD